MTRAHKIRLNPTLEQLIYFYRAAGIARFAWNWGLDYYHQAKAAGRAVDWNDAKKEFRAHIDAEYPFVREVTKCAAEQAFNDLRQALNTYYKVKSENPKSKIRFPGKRRRSRKIGGFGLNNDQFRVAGHFVTVPKLGLVNLAEELRFRGKILNGRIKEQGGQWYLIVTVALGEVLGIGRENSAQEDKPSGSIGIDFGLSRFATYSDGSYSETQAYFRRSERKLKRLQRGLARKQKGSGNRVRWKRRVSRQHGRVARLRRDFQHKLSHAVTQKYELICVEDLNLAGLCRAGNLSKSFYDAGIGETMRQLSYKAEAAGGCVQKVGRYFPSSKRCHRCHWLKEGLTLGEREWQCGGCGAGHDRDVNAALNIKQEGERLHAGTG